MKEVLRYKCIVMLQFRDFFSFSRVFLFTYLDTQHQQPSELSSHFSVSVSPFYIVLKCDKIIFNFDKNKSFVTKYGFENQDGDHGN